MNSLDLDGKHFFEIVNGKVIKPELVNIYRIAGSKEYEYGQVFGGRLVQVFKDDEILVIEEDNG
jgi:hypothetical protein